MPAVKFDHNATASEEVCKDGRFLVQNGQYFSYAEFKREKKRYVPEPVPVDREKVSEDALRVLLKKVLDELVALKPSVDQLAKTIEKNPELFIGK